MINKLTFEQEQRIKEYYNSYLSRGLSTKPSNKSIAENAVKRMYSLVDKKAPRVFWVKSPTALISLFKNRSSLWNSLDNSLDNSIRKFLRDSLWNSLDNSLWNSLDNSLWSSLRDSLWNSLDNSLWSSLWNSLWSSLWNSLGSSLIYAQTNANWISFYKYCNEVLGIKYGEEELEKLNLWVDMMECSCFFTFEKVVILMEHPKEIHTDSKGNNHNMDDFAIKWYDDTGIYAIHGEIFDRLDIEQLFKDKKITNIEYLESKSGECPTVS